MVGCYFGYGNAHTHKHKNTHYIFHPNDNDNLKNERFWLVQFICLMVYGLFNEKFDLFLNVDYNHNYIFSVSHNY